MYSRGNAAAALIFNAFVVGSLQGVERESLKHMREHNNKHRKRKTPGARENSDLGRKLLAVFPFLFSSFLLCSLVLELSFCH